MNRRWDVVRLACLVVAMATTATGVHVATATADAISATCSVGGQTLPCTTPWFTAPVQVVWSADPPPVPQPPPSCELGVAYSFTVDTAQVLSCQAEWSDGTKASVSFPFNLEVSSPTATATPSRPPDSNGWYDAPVTIGFSGNAFSGIGSCTPAQTYAGPATAGTTVSGSCTDDAGKTATAGLPLRYDATPPAVSLSAVAGDGSVALSWAASSGPAPLSTVTLVRSPGTSGPATALIATAPTGPITDTGVKDHVRYTYTLTATDEAGNTSTRTVSATPAARLLTPAVGVALKRPPVLSWTSVPRADYYNVQLFHGGKVLSAWPRAARLRLHRSWRYAGRRHRLTKGRYRWYVWPGYGRLSKDRYGKLIGSGTFVVR